MKILQLDVDSISYELIKPEIAVHEKSDEKKVSLKDALVLLISVEDGDTNEIADNALKDSESYMKKQHIKQLLLYPFAHLSNSLASPEDALKIIEHMQSSASKEFNVKHAPFGWNKWWSISIKSHPLAEQSKSYGANAKMASKKKVMAHGAKEVNTSIVKKSDWSGLPDTDHRTIGEKLDLYSFQEVSPGMVYWHPKGLIMYQELLRFIRENQGRYGYQEISTPTIANLALWHVSGHIDHYKSNMYIFESEGQEYGLKPMNCPSSILIYKTKNWSYRDLPFRSSIMDRLYRNEISGALTGLFRVREFTQDDSHIFVREDQLQEELNNVLKLLDETYATFGFTYKAKLSTMPDDHMGDEKLWEKATEGLRKALEANKIKYVVKEKEGAFYGPKIDVDIKDSMGREWQCATIQIDYQMPLRFKLEYVGDDGQPHTPAMIHRTIYGSLERFMGILVEHFQGKFPTWLSPIQVRVITISEQSNKYADHIFNELKRSKIRVELDISDKTLEYKIRDAQLQKIPYMVIIGSKEAEQKKITVRGRSGKQKMGIKLEEFLSEIKKEIESRSNNQLV